MLFRAGAIVLASVLAAILGAQEPPTLPDWAIKRAVSLGKAIDCGGSSADRTYNIAGYQIRVQPEKEMTVAGRDRSGQAWLVSIGYPGDGGCRLFVNDLDKNGYPDVMFLNANSGSGPNGVTMTIVAFDKLGRPVPWQATGPFDLRGERVSGLVDLDGDQKAELLFQYVEGTPAEMAVRTALYQIANGHFKRSDGVFAGRRFPLEDSAGRLLLGEPDLSNALDTASGRAQRLMGLKMSESGPCWLKGISLTDKGIVIPPDSQASGECHGYLHVGQKDKVGFPLITVLDLPQEGRLAEVNYSMDLIRRAVSLSMPVVFVGRSCETGCRPFIMWAGPTEGTPDAAVTRPGAARQRSRP